MKLITENWKIKVASLILATFTWMYVRDLKLNTVNISVPITYESKPGNLTWKKDPPRYLKIKIRGRQEDLKFPTSSLRAIINLKNAKRGRNNYPVFFDENQLPEKISVSGSVRKIRLYFDLTIQKKVNVIATIQGQPAQGFVTGKITINPKVVTIEGAEADLKKISEISTELISIAKANKTIQKKVSFLPPKNVKVSSAKEADIRILIQTDSNAKQKIISNVNITLKNLDPKLKATLSQKSITIHIKGEPQELQQMSVSSFQAYINLESTTYNRKTRIILPTDTGENIPIQVKILSSNPSVEITEVSPEKVTVKFTLKKVLKPKPVKPDSPKDKPVVE